MIFVKFMKQFKILSLCLVPALMAAAALAAVQELPGKVLIAYYSRTGNTRMACEVVQKALGADIMEIKDLNSREPGLGIAGGMLKTLLGWHTDISPRQVDLSSYSLVILSSPIWAGRVAPAMRTFIETNDLKGKKVLLFTTSDGLLEEKHQNISKKFVTDVGGRVVGYVQVVAADKVGDEKVPRTRERILEEAARAAEEVQSIVAKLMGG